ncbi:hypothetical protein EMCRGX_G028380 [Ephydatia muelleri]
MMFLSCLQAPVDYPSIYTYFIETPGGYTRERLKAFKSLEAYKWLALVNSSQCLSEKPHQPWVAVEKQCGTVVTAHGTCMAGLGEVCSHIGAVLFKVEACVRLRNESVTCMSLPCTWNQTFSTKLW